MNIFTKPYNGEFFYCRPDTSIKRDSNDYFCLDQITKLTVFSLIYIKMDKPGKAIKSRFAKRYYSTGGYGVHIIPTQLLDKNHPFSYWVAGSIDSSTLISKPNSIEIFSPAEIEKINNTIEEISKYTSLRIGDYITIEYNPQEIEKGTTTLMHNNFNINIVW